MYKKIITPSQGRKENMVGRTTRFMAEIALEQGIYKCNYCNGSTNAKTFVIL